MTSYLFIINHYAMLIVVYIAMLICVTTGYSIDEKQNRKSFLVSKYYEWKSLTQRAVLRGMKPGPNSPMHQRERRLFMYSGHATFPTTGLCLTSMHAARQLVKKFHRRLLHKIARLLRTALALTRMFRLHGL